MKERNEGWVGLVKIGQIKSGVKESNFLNSNKNNPTLKYVITVIMYGENLIERYKRGSQSRYHLPGYTADDLNPKSN